MTTYKQPEIYVFLEGKFTGVYERFKELDDKMATMQSSITVMESREKPSAPCRDLIFRLKGEYEAAIKTNKDDIDAVSNKIHNRVRYSFFWTIIAASFIYTTWSFLYTRSIENELKVLRDIDRKHENQRESSIGR